MTSFSKHLYDCLENPKSSKWGVVLQSLIIFMIVLNIIGMSLDTVEEIRLSHGELLDTIELITVTFFTIELLL